jgi:hypothetical protein
MKKYFLFFSLISQAAFGQTGAMKAKNTRINNGRIYYDNANVLMDKGDTMNACFNFMLAKMAGFYKPKAYYNDGEDEQQDDVVKFCYDDEGLIKSGLQKNQKYKLLNYPPIEFVSALIVSDEFSPVLKIEVHNNQSRTVNAFRCKVECFTNFGEPVRGVSRTNFGTITNQETIEPGQDGGVGTTYSLWFKDGIGKAKVTLLKVHFSDGTIWTPKPDQKITIWAQLNR